VEFEFSRQFLGEKSTNIKFYQNPFSGIRVVPCGQTDGRTDMTKLIVTFRNFLNAPQNTLLPTVTVQQMQHADERVCRVSFASACTSLATARLPAV
jgi:hypothetical protein